MARIHRELALESGKADPLRHIARGLARQYRVLCFDEVQVSDIGDAMLLGRLFDQLLQSGVTLVATSNQPPGELYPDGLQRERFLPAIRLLEQKLQVQALDGGRDHRRRPQPQADVLLRAPANAQLARHFANLTGLAAADGAPGQAPARSQLTLCNRPISVHARHSGVLWLTFSALCQGSRSSLDYIELAQRFHTLLLSDVPVFRGPVREGIKARGTEDGSFTPTTTGNRQVRWSAMDDPARRFISLIDELYDRNVTLYLSAEAEPESLYQQGQLQFEFQRTLSRLIEMQSQDYLLRPHRP
jgi:cell division protein ZapE